MPKVLNQTVYWIRSYLRVLHNQWSRLLAVAALAWLSMGMAAGQTWTRDWSVTQYVRTLLADPVTPTTLYAGLVNDASYPYSGVAKTIDGGNTWTIVSAGL